MTLIDIAVVLWPLVGTLLILLFGRFLSRRMRAETAQAREAEKLARQQAHHTTR